VADFNISHVLHVSDHITYIKATKTFNPLIFWFWDLAVVTGIQFTVVNVHLKHEIRPTKTGLMFHFTNRSSVEQIYLFLQRYTADIQLSRIESRCQSITTILW
jgi:hypothetical protein